MRIIRSILLALLFIGGVFIASANVHLVELVVFPDTGIDALPKKISIELPLFLVVIATLCGGVLLGGLAAAFEQVRLRHGLRRARKERDRAVAEQGKADALLDGARAEADGLRAQIAELSEDLADARGGREEPLSPFVEPETEPQTPVDVAAETSTDEGAEDAQTRAAGPHAAARSDD